METRIQSEFDKILRYCENNDVPEYMLQQSIVYQEGLWRSYLSMIQSMIPFDFEGKVVMDFGCKYGHVLPIFIILGAIRAIGIDAENEYVEAGDAVIGQLYPNIEFLQSELGYIPLQPESVDFVFVNEVISHVIPCYLETVYFEVSRILKKGGMVLISDGNNRGNAQCRKKLVPLYNAWENGPDGTETDRDTVVKSYLTRRKEIICNRQPNLDEETIDYLAKNTSGLFGDFLIKIIDHYVETGEIILRPYRMGICPTNPGHSGVMMERSFHPLQVEMSLEGYGIECYQILPKFSFSRISLRGWLNDTYSFLSYQVKRAKNILKPGWQKVESEGFQIIGVKKY